MKIRIRKKKISVTAFSKTDRKNHDTWMLVVLAILSVLVVINIVGSYYFGGATTVVLVEPQKVATGVLKPGASAPGFILSNLTNGKVSNLNFVGSPLIIIFWATWNQTSVDEMRIIDSYVAKNPGLNIKALAVNSQEDADLVFSFVKRGGYKIPVALDQNGGVGEIYGAHNLPVIYFINKSGAVAGSAVGRLNEAELTQGIRNIID